MKSQSTLKIRLTLIVLICAVFTLILSLRPRDLPGVKKRVISKAGSTYLPIDPQNQAGNGCSCIICAISMLSGYYDCFDSQEIIRDKARKQGLYSENEKSADMSFIIQYFSDKGLAPALIHVTPERIKYLIENQIPVMCFPFYDGGPHAILINGYRGKNGSFYYFDTNTVDAHSLD
ncbi:MAG: papain-like cysteine protease family protein, partial [Candidatus Wallbacteria bacterium]|nr:papain-like cysteine protease family protein [Candidatus Wallbacteria bacterium]